jgi:hypothetical protein
LINIKYITFCRQKLYKDYKHPEDPRQPKLDRYYAKKDESGIHMYGKGSAQQRKLEHCVLKLIVDCSLPMSIVEHPTFREMVKALDPRFNPMSR